MSNNNLSKFSKIDIPLENMFTSFPTNDSSVMMFSFPKNSILWNWYFLRPSRLIEKKENHYTVLFYENERISINRKINQGVSKNKSRLLDFIKLKEAFEHAK